MRRLLLALGTAGLALGVGIDPAGAAKPANHACLGADASAAAQAGGGDFGQVIAGIASSAPGAIGDEVQLHLAGLIPDSVFPNSCND